jgi:hypothetical protein
MAINPDGGEERGYRMEDGDVIWNIFGDVFGDARSLGAMRRGNSVMQNGYFGSTRAGQIVPRLRRIWRRKKQRSKENVGKENRSARKATSREEVI